MVATKCRTSREYDQDTEQDRMTVGDRGAVNPAMAAFVEFVKH